MSVVERIQLLRNVGKFDSVNAGGQLPFSKLTLVFAENGRGKTTIAAILRSLSDGNAQHILERKRLTATSAPHVVVNVAGVNPCIFQNGAWSATLPDVVIFDDAFVAQNVCSGIDIEAGHRQNLHELILGAQGVTLNAAVQAHAAKVEDHNKELRARENAIPAAARGSLTVDAFCALKVVPNIAEAITAAARSLSAAQASDKVHREQDFAAIALPAFDTTALNQLLKRDLPGLEAKAAELVKKHFAAIGEGGERWVGDGMHRIPAASDHAACPFCAQDLGGSPLIKHYQAYFSESYTALIQSIERVIREARMAHDGDVPAAFERDVRVWEQRKQFWKDFTVVPDFSVDTAAVARAWKVAREAVYGDLQKKKSAPLEPYELSADTLKVIADYDTLRATVAATSSTLTALNEQIKIVKEKAATANVATLTGDLEKLKAAEARHSPTVAPLCADYLAEKAAKKATEGLRDKAREALETYRATVFPAYEAAINDYLRKFGAGFRLGAVESVNNRGGSSCTYNVIIDNVAVPLTGDPGAPAFKNTLSAGDRNTLALAFFFASIDRDPQLAQKIVVIDDPMTSLDENRSLTTIQEMYRLIGKVAQVVVLSHSRPFLCAMWEKSDRIGRAAIKVIRDRDGSNLVVWDVKQDSITEHDKRHAKVVDYIGSNNAADEREVAESLRPILESFMRVAYPEDFPPDSLLGPFLNKCMQRIGQQNQILTQADANELQDLLEYTNKFHHDSNPAWQTEIINDQELHRFCERTLAFAKRS
ncbi:wobble nucleotide-excising tRNase [Bradyrhizobium sp. AZCC 2262]|uniref:AAA family ATPase n=1 Tax=Bradyrhizobium sp. AZCC 2262 TaxID=3117022 RepID=UPI002FF35A3E